MMLRVNEYLGSAFDRREPATGNLGKLHCTRPCWESCGHLTIHGYFLAPSWVVSQIIKILDDGEKELEAKPHSLTESLAMNHALITEFDPVVVREC